MAKIIRRFQIVCLIRVKNMAVLEGKCKIEQLNNIFTTVIKTQLNTAKVVLGITNWDLCYFSFVCPCEIFRLQNILFFLTKWVVAMETANISQLTSASLLLFAKYLEWKYFPKISTYYLFSRTKSCNCVNCYLLCILDGVKKRLAKCKAQSGTFLLCSRHSCIFF